MDAARGAIAARGVTGMRIDDVAELAGTSHGTLYLYFQDKEDLLDALVEDAAHEFRLLARATPLVARSNAAAVADWTSQVIASVAHHRPSITAALGSRPGFELHDLLAPLRPALLKRLTSQDHLAVDAVVDAWIGMVVWHGFTDDPDDGAPAVTTELLLRGVTDEQATAGSASTAE